MMILPLKNDGFGAIRSDMGGGGGGAAVPFVLGEMGHFVTVESPHLPVGAFCVEVQAATHATAARTELCAVATAEGLNHKGDELHFVSMSPPALA